MAGLFSRLKVWAGLEVIQNSDLNGEIDNIIQNLGPSGMSGWSASIAQMKIQTSPGSFGAESIATTESGEIERIRYQLNAIIGGVDGVWYDQPTLSISQISKLLTTAPPNNRIVSGAVSGTSKQPMHLLAAGSSPSVTLKCSVTPFVCVINGTTYTFTVDITLGSLAVAPTTNNTFVLNDANCDLSAKTSSFGDYIADNFNALADGSVRPLADYPINGTTVGSNIVSSIGTFQAFSYTHSATTEYFLGFVNQGVSSSVVGLSKAKRGFFFNNIGSPIPAIPLNNAEAVTLLKLIWIYVTTSGTLLAVYTHPRYSSVQPTSSAAGDMWYDITNQQWKQSNGSTYSAANATLVGVAVTDGTNCVAARSFDWYGSYVDFSNVAPEFYTTSEYRTKYDNNVINVYGTTFNFDKDQLRWSASNLESGTTLTNSNIYYLYLTETGAPLISKFFPHKRFDLGGYYHPYNSWRCCGVFLYNSSGQFDSVVLSRFGELNGEFVNDKSLSIAKRKTTYPVITDINAASPLTAPIDAFGFSTVASIAAASASLINIQDTNAKNLTVNINTTGRPVFFGLIPDGTSTPGIIQVNEGTGIFSNEIAQIGFYMDGTLISISQMASWIYNHSNTGPTFAPQNFWGINPSVPAGLHAFTVKYLATSGGTPGAAITNCKLFAFEI